jgi:formylmethanofuran dehydrogenase subunit D
MILINNEQVKAQDLKVGSEIKVQTLFGWADMVVRSFEPDIDINKPKTATAYTPNGKFGAWLKIEDGYWISEMCFDPEAICRVQIV